MKETGFNCWFCHNPNNQCQKVDSSLKQLSLRSLPLETHNQSVSLCPYKNRNILIIQEHPKKSLSLRIIMPVRQLLKYMQKQEKTINNEIDSTLSAL